MLGFLKKKIAETLKKPSQKRRLDELETVLIQSGMALEVVDRIIAELKQSQDSRQSLSSILSDSMKSGKLNLKKRPYVIMLCGINGVGKTTVAAKLASYLKKKKIESVFAASDTFRAAAIEQLQIHADKLGVRMIKQKYGADPAAVAYDAVEHAKTSGKGAVIIDTSGRLHVDSGLMRELEKVKRVVKPDISLLVVDATTGNDAVEQARAFNQIIDGFIITKLDIDERGGAVVSVSAVTGKPIYFVSTGQKYGDFQEFSVKKIIKAIGL
ncbi:MAG: signal recognition particle-docking protein FtsY [Candidatus Altiarchaeota archaeon]|nr:signal recognition particle-docking protein FtsY [Candidatus Altiarchaeota archaeon]